MADNEYGLAVLVVLNEWVHHQASRRDWVVREIRYTPPPLLSKSVLWGALNMQGARSRSHQLRIGAR